MDKLEVVLRKLKEEGTEAYIKETNYGSGTFKIIETKDTSIFQYDIAIGEDKLAWLEKDGDSTHLLRIFSGEMSFSWTPITYNPIFGCLCLLIEWMDDFLIFIYQETHTIYVCAAKDGVVNYFNFKGEEIERNGNLIAYDTYCDRMHDQVRLIRLPDLKELEPISVEEARKMNLIPQGLNRPDGFLNQKEDSGC